MNTYYYRDEDKPRVDIFSHKTSGNMAEMGVGLVFVVPIAVTFGVTAQSSWAGRGTAHAGCMGIKYIVMAQTGTGKKKVFVHGHTKENGVEVPPHYRSTPNTSSGKK